VSVANPTGTKHKATQKFDGRRRKNLSASSCPNSVSELRKSAHKGTSKDQADSLRHPCLISTASHSLVGENQSSQKTSFCSAWFLRFLGFEFAKNRQVIHKSGIYSFLFLLFFLYSSVFN